MKLFLESQLAGHRHGRFFKAQLNATESDTMPKEGCVLMHGRAFQQKDKQEQAEWWDWTAQPGHALLLIPPFELGQVSPELDWQIVAQIDAVSSNDGIIPTTLSAEATQRVDGTDGEFDREQGHQWSDYSVNTRFFKRHQGCGVFAVTCLPLWSIALLDYPEESEAWLASIFARAGKASDQNASAEKKLTDDELIPLDYTVMVCLQAWQISSAKDLIGRLSTMPFSPFNLSEEQIHKGFLRLADAGFLTDDGLNDRGLSLLSSSPYANYAVRLKEEERNERS